MTAPMITAIATPDDWRPADAIPSLGPVAPSILAPRLYQSYHVRLQFRNRVCGGVPKDPKIIEGWIGAAAGINDKEEKRQMLIRTMEELGAEVRPGMTLEELMEASQALAAERHTNGFYRNANGWPVLRARHVQSMLKENTNIVYPGERVGPTRKGILNYLAERVTVDDDMFHLGKPEIDGIETSIAHISGPSGKRSSLTYVEFIEYGIAEFTVKVQRDAEKILGTMWTSIWESAQENGLGARRSQLYGKFNLLAWDKV